MLDSKGIEEKIRGFLTGPAGGRRLDENDDIFAQGVVNSLFAFQLVLFLEREFRISIENEDLELDNFRSISNMTRFVELKRA